MNLESLEKKISSLEQEVSALREKENKLVLIVSSGDLDKVLPAFIIAVGAASMQVEVTMFFTFWGFNAIRQKRIYSNKSITEKLMSLMSPRSFRKLPVSKMNMLGIGPVFMKRLMKEHNVTSLSELIKLAQELGVKLVACQMTMSIMGICQEELISGLEYGGVSSCLEEALHAKLTLFI